MFWLTVAYSLACLPLAFWWCCCRQTGCVRFAARATNTIANYSVRSGSWTVSAGSGFIGTTSSNALALFGAETGSNYHRNYCSFTLAAVGDTAKLVGGYLDDSNYVYASIEKIADVGPTPAFNLKLYKRVAGAETLLDSTSIIWGPATSAALCAGDDKLTFSFGGTGSVYLLTNGLPYTFGKKGGVGTGTVIGSVTFGFQELSNHYSYDQTCPRCPCLAPACPGGTYPKQYELIPTAGPYSGVSCILDQSGDNNGYCEYIGSVGGLAAFAQIPVTDAGGVLIQVQCTRLFGVNVVTTDCTTIGSGTIPAGGGGFGCWSTFTIQGIPGP